MRFELINALIVGLAPTEWDNARSDDIANKAYKDIDTFVRELSKKYPDLVWTLD